jgi:membrane-bound lytic murein transglycosylase D
VKPIARRLATGEKAHWRWELSRCDNSAAFSGRLLGASARVVIPASSWCRWTRLYSSQRDESHLRRSLSDNSLRMHLHWRILKILLALTDASLLIADEIAPRRLVKTIGLMILCFALLFAAKAQDRIVPADILQQANEWLNENIDDAALDALGVDKDRVQKFLNEVQKRFQGTYVYDLGALRDTARQIQPLLESFEETLPYALWLKTHFDYFEVSERLRKEVAVKSTNMTQLPNASPQLQRSIWVKVIEERPAPATTNKQLARLKQIFTEEHVPPQLAWIAEVESSFDARARSPAGAAGMFQLMPATARSLDLSVGLLRDERLHPEKSGRAAARYLRRLYNRFGDWRLALAAYNAGEGRVSALLKKHKGRTYDDINQFLPVETQMYVPKIEATLRKRERVALSDLKTPKA